MLKEDFILKYSPLAIEAGRKFNINPKIILAQAALESGWASSYSAKVRHNFFGITALGKTNAYWDGNKSTASSGLSFRIYKTDKDSFMDFARLISEKYPTAAAASYDHKKYAKLIAQSPYISEKNGDNRTIYESTLSKTLEWIDKNIKINSNNNSWFVASAVFIFTLGIAKLL